MWDLVVLLPRGWSGGAMVLGKLPVPGRPTIWMIVGQGPNALTVGGGGGCLDIFTFLYPFSSLSPSFWETARFRLKYCLKGPLSPKQPTNQPMFYYLIISEFFVTLVPDHCLFFASLQHPILCLSNGGCCNRVATVREKYPENEIFPGQGKVREF